VDAKSWKQPTADERANDSNDQIPNQTEPGASHDLACQPSGDESDQEYDKKAFTRHAHLRTLRSWWPDRSQAGNAKPYTNTVA
jgi:hypothetical protein